MHPGGAATCGPYRRVQNAYPEGWRLQCCNGGRGATPIRQDALLIPFCSMPLPLEGVPWCSTLLPKQLIPLLAAHGSWNTCSRTHIPEVAQRGARMRNLSSLS
jgi:hypothetical protein